MAIQKKILRIFDIYISSLAVRRTGDLGLNPWYAVFMFIPVINQNLESIGLLDLEDEFFYSI